MSDRTKLILAITLGSLGLVIGIVATITAFNAKNEAQKDASVSTMVDQRFAEAQANQDALEKKQASDAEQFVARLTGKEKSLVTKLNKQSNQIRKLRQQTRNLSNDVDTLTSRQKEQGDEISKLESKQKSDDDSLNKRINNLNQEIKKTNRRINRTNSELDALLP